MSTFIQKFGLIARTHTPPKYHLTDRSYSNEHSTSRSTVAWIFRIVTLIEIHLCVAIRHMLEPKRSARSQGARYLFSARFKVHGLKWNDWVSIWTKPWNLRITCCAAFQRAAQTELNLDKCASVFTFIAIPIHLVKGIIMLAFTTQRAASEELLPMISFQRSNLLCTACLFLNEKIITMSKHLYYWNAQDVIGSVPSAHVSSILFPILLFRRYCLYDRSI